MGLIGNIAAGLRALAGRTSVEREMDEELRGFLESSAEQKVRAGMTPEQAVRAARAEMGSANAVKHRIRSTGWETAIENLWQDLCYSLRMLAKSPVFTLVAVGSLALGIGANTAIFSLINAVILKTLPVSHPEQLVQLVMKTENGTTFTNPIWEQVRDRQDVFSGAFAYSPIQLNLAGGGEVRNASASDRIAMAANPGLERKARSA